MKRMRSSDLEKATTVVLTSSTWILKKLSTRFHGKGCSTRSELTVFKDEPLDGSVFVLGQGLTHWIFEFDMEDWTSSKISSV
jgi:hypothetical protein